MRVTRHSPIVHPRLSRREWLQAGSIGLMGLSLSDVEAAREANRTAPQKSVIYLFLSGGLGQHDSFDMKPDAPAKVRGEFRPIPVHFWRNLVGNSSLKTSNLIHMIN